MNIARFQGRSTPMTFQRGLAVAFFLILGLGFSGCTRAPQPYSFSVFGDSRLPGNMHFTREQQGEGGPIDAYIRSSFNGKTIADCELRFADNGYLIGLRIPAVGDPHKEISFDGDGWPATIIDSSQEPNLTLREGGLSWVYQAVLHEVAKAGEGGFALHTGDIAYNGYYGTSPQTSIYWADFRDRFLDRLPPGVPQGLPGRFFPAVGNHETWLDPDLQGLRNTVPYLEDLGVSADRHIYAFDYHNSRFIFLDTGGYDPPAGWGKDSKPGYDAQMKQLQDWLTEAQARGITHVFITLHKPPFCSAGHGHLAAQQNPHPLLARFANDPDRPLDLTVFSGHVHSSELYYRDGIRYLVLGGGGADQVYRTIDCAASDPYCQDELYWQGAKRMMEYNHLTVTVSGKDVGMVLERWRPEASQPYQRCVIDQAMQISGCE
jgi:hypothetical protein